jgi:hypothetical protein
VRVGARCLNQASIHSGVQLDHIGVIDWAETPR